MGEMRKTFPLDASGHKPARVIESIKNDIRKYVKRERRKDLPETVDFWDFDCRVGVDAESAEGVHLAVINAAIDTASQAEGTTVYVEVLTKQGFRTSKPREIAPSISPPEKTDSVEDADPNDGTDAE
tara:strand:- start:2201 stop:2581 length:381 start_codon:yes stop_codon:yes gene_type:complete